MNNRRKIYALLSTLFVILNLYALNEKNKKITVNLDNEIQLESIIDENKNIKTEPSIIDTKKINEEVLINDNETKINEKVLIPNATNNTYNDVTLSFIGDCTIGSDPTFGYNGSFNYVFNKNNKDYNYFFKNVKSVLSKDDLTIANLETTFTKATKEQSKTFNFKGDTSYVNILKAGSVEVVNIANNHINDFLNKGFNDTINTLDNANVSHYGFSSYIIKEIDGIKIGIAGFNALSSYSNAKIDVLKAMKYFKSHHTDFEIITFHWGIERKYQFTSTQQYLAHYSINNGADLIVGHHPHVLEGIEKYKNKYIVYSLGNFVFGGNRNPSDKDSMIMQYIIKIKNGKIDNGEINLIPISISSKTTYNDYQPYIIKELNKTRVLNKINKYSHNFKYTE